MRYFVVYDGKEPLAAFRYEWAARVFVSEIKTKSQNIVVKSENVPIFYKEL